MDKNSRVIGNRLQNGALTSEQVGAYNIYKGARYVPKIMGQWDANVNYEPLSIVINQGNSYTSAQYVPAGVPLQESGPFWFKTGNFNGQISSLEQRVNTNETNISNLITQTNQNNSDITELKNKTRKGKPLLLGDSFGEGFVEGFGSSPTYGWAYYIDNYVKDYYIQVESGSGFIGLGARTYAEMLDSITQTDIDEIYIQTAGNDYGQSYPNQVNAINSFALKAFSKFPLLDKIYIIYNVNSGSNLLSKANDIINYIKNADNLNPNVVVANNFQMIAHNLKFYNPIDGFHPSIEGAKEIARCIGNYVKDKTFTYQKALIDVNSNGFRMWSILMENGYTFNNSAPWNPPTFETDRYNVLNLTYGTNCPVIRGNYTLGIGYVVSNWKLLQTGIFRVTNDKLQFVTSELQQTSNIHLIYSLFIPYNGMND